MKYLILIGALFPSMALSNYGPEAYLAEFTPGKFPQEVYSVPVERPPQSFTSIRPEPAKDSPVILATLAK